MDTTYRCFDKRVSTRRSNSDEEGRRAAEERDRLRRAVNRRRIVERGYRPVTRDLNGLVADRNGRRDWVGGVNRLVEDRAVGPDHLVVVVFDFRRFVLLRGGVDVRLELMWSEMAVGDGVLVFVAGARLVDVRGRERGRERQERDRHEQRGGARHDTNHARIIQAWRRAVNQPAVTRRSETGQ